LHLAALIRQSLVTNISLATANKNCKMLKDFLMQLSSFYPVLHLISNNNNRSSHGVEQTQLNRKKSFTILQIVNEILIFKERRISAYLLGLSPSARLISHSSVQRAGSWQAFRVMHADKCPDSSNIK